MRKLFVVFLGLAFVLTAVNAWAVSADGEKLIRELFADIKAKKFAAVESRIAQGFQSAHQDGARDRDTEIKLIRKLNLGPYTLSDFKVTRNGPVIVVTYFAAAKQTIKGKVLSTKPAARISVWLKTDKGWQWMAHANLNPLK